MTICNVKGVTCSDKRIITLYSPPQFFILPSAHCFGLLARNLTVLVHSHHSQNFGFGCSCFEQI